MTNSEIRKFAKDLLPGGKAVLGYLMGFGLPILCTFLVSGFTMIRTIPILFDIMRNVGSSGTDLSIIWEVYSRMGSGFLGTIVTLAFAFMTELFFYEYLRTRELEMKNFFKPYNNFITVVLTYILRQLFVFLWSLLFLIPGLIKSYAYALTPYILRDSEYQLKYNDAIQKSQEMMSGYKMQMFCLDFGYFFHYILMGLTLGIYGLWLLPRIELAHATFYETVKKEYNERMRKEIVSNPQDYSYQNNNNGDMQSYQRQYPNNNNR